MMSVIDLNAILECNELRYRTNGFLVCYLYLNYSDLMSVTEIDFGLVMQPILMKDCDIDRRGQTYCPMVLLKRGYLRSEFIQVPE